MTLAALKSASAALLLGVSSALALPRAPAADPPAAASPRPLVLMLPGRGYLARDTADLRRDWWGALDRALAGLGAPGVLEASDFRLVWYADALDLTVRATCTDRARRRGPPHEAEEVASVLASGLAAAALVADWSGGLDGAPVRALAGDLLYLGDERRRCAAEERLADAVQEAVRSGRTVVLVTHSFGSLVAQGHLVNRPEHGAPPIERWITIGSLAGWPDLRELLLGRAGRTAALPPDVRSWVNVWDPRDVLGSPLLELSAEARRSDAIRDVETESTPIGDPHDPARYLSDPATVRALLESLCPGLDTRRDGGSGGLRIAAPECAGHI